METHNKMTTYQDMEGNTITADNSYDGKHVTINYQGKGLDFFYKNQKAYAYHEGKPINLVLTFPDSDKWYKVMSYNDTWQTEDKSNGFQQLIIVSNPNDSAKKGVNNSVFNPKSKMYLYDIWTDSSPNAMGYGKGSDFRFAVQGPPYSITSSGDVPGKNLPDGIYTFLPLPDIKLQFQFSILKNRLYAYSSEEKNHDTNMVFTFPQSAGQPTDFGQLFKQEDDNNKYQLVSKTADGYIYNPESNLYFTVTQDLNDKLIFSFNTSKPPPMKYFSGAWNDNVVFASTFDGTVPPDSIISFCQATDEAGNQRMGTNSACIDWKNGNFSGPASATCLTDNNCKSNMLNFCKQNDNLLYSVCQHFCANSGNCEETVKAYCKNIYNTTNSINDPKYTNVCGCYYPDDLYFGMVTDLQDYATKHQFPSVSNTISKACYFPQCASAIIKPPNLQPVSSCPAIVNCIQYTDPNLGTVTGNFSFNNTLSTCNMDKICNPPMYYDTDSGKCACPEGDNYDPDTKTCKHGVVPPSPPPPPTPAPSPSPFSSIIDFYNKHKTVVIVVGVILTLLILGVIFYQLSSS